MLRSTFLRNLASFSVKNAKFFANLFGKNIIKILTSVPGHTAMPARPPSRKLLQIQRRQNFRHTCKSRVTGWAYEKNAQIVTQQIFLRKIMRKLRIQTVEIVSYFCDFQKNCLKWTITQGAKIRPIWSPCLQRWQQTFVCGAVEEDLDQDCQINLATTYQNGWKYTKCCQIFLATTYQNGGKYSKLPDNIPHGHKICQMAGTLTKWP
jgi:hypothetical protein